MKRAHLVALTGAMAKRRESPAAIRNVVAAALWASRRSPDFAALADFAFPLRYQVRTGVRNPVLSDPRETTISKKGENR